MPEPLWQFNKDMIKNLQVCISKFQVSGLFSHLCLGVPTHKNKSIFVGGAICTGRRISNPRGNFILKFFHLSQAIQLDPCLAHVTHQCTTPAVFKRKIKSKAKFSENLYIKGCDNIWYRWQTFSYGEYGLNMNEQWDVTSTALRGINMTKTTWGTLKHKPFSGWANCSKEVLLEISTA